MSEERIKNEGQFEVGFEKGNVPLKINCNDFYIKDGFVVVEYKDGGIEYWPASRVAYIGKKGNQKDAI